VKVQTAKKGFTAKLFSWLSCCLS